MSIYTAKITIIEYCRKLYDKGYLPGLDGNISMRADEDAVLITPSSVGKDVVKPEELVLVDLNGNPADKNKKPSIETPMHIAAYKESKSTNAVIHMHSPYVNAFALARHTIDTRHAPFAHYHLGQIGYVTYSTPGGALFHDEVRSSLKKGHRVLLLESHGSMVIAPDMTGAYANADLLENYAKMLINAKALGGAHMLCDEELKDIYGG